MKMERHPKLQKQNFKIDEIALVLIVAVLTIFASFADRKAGHIDAQEITEIIMDDHYFSFASGGVIDESRLKNLQEMRYEDLKKSLNTNKDFCMYIEDGHGNIIMEKGSSRLGKDGLYCGQ